jgi:hypothetical protein
VAKWEVQTLAKTTVLLYFSASGHIMKLTALICMYGVVGLCVTPPCSLVAGRHCGRTRCLHLSLRWTPNLHVATIKWVDMVFRWRNVLNSPACL